MTERRKTPALVRTIVPMIVGALSAWLMERLGVTLPVEHATEALTAFLSALYYAAVLWLEERFPSLGLLLGSRQAPEYPATGRHRPERVNADATEE